MPVWVVFRLSFCDCIFDSTEHPNVNNRVYNTPMENWKCVYVNHLVFIHVCG